jgi:hypothetical protein
MPDRIRLRDLLPPCVLGDPYGFAAAGDDLLHADPARALGAAHDVAARLNESRRAAGGPWIHAGQIQALVLLTAAAAALLRRFAADRDPGLWRAARRWLEDDLGRDTVAALRQALDARVRPPAAEVLDAPPGADADADWLLPLLLLGLAGGNRALDPVRDLIDDAPLRARPGYARAWPSLLAYLGRLPAFDAHVDSLAELLVLPQRLAPDDLLAQLLRAHEAWSPWLGDEAPPLLLAAGVLHEERRARFEGAGAAPEISFAEAAAPVAGAPAATRDEEHESVRYSHDREWMPSLVLLAKNTHVWLHQLSRRYGRPVARLDQVPDEELDEIASRGVTGLWLIGIWQRSRASRTIKQRRGNPEALASAYALDDYRVADDLGGEEALADLRRRAEARGVRLAGDMVPNHTGLDGRWVVERPDLFLSLDHRRGPLVRPARDHPPGGPLRRPQRRRHRLPPDRPRHRPCPLHLPRQRRHQHAVERHGADRLPQPRRARGRDPGSPRGGAPLPRDPLRRRHGPGPPPRAAPLVPRPRRGQRHPGPRGARPVAGGVRRGHAS